MIILHLAPEARWLAWPDDADYLPAEYPNDGFVHCTAGDALLLAVANRYYRGHAGAFVALSVDVARLTVPLRWEAPADGLAEHFPHVYGAIDRVAIVAVRRAERAADGAFVGLGVPLGATR
jgi:uncharacterized protein (DUF952 family)